VATVRMALGSMAKIFFLKTVRSTSRKAMNSGPIIPAASIHCSAMEPYISSMNPWRWPHCGHYVPVPAAKLLRTCHSRWIIYISRDCITSKNQLKYELMKAIFVVVGAILIFTSGCNKHQQLAVVHGTITLAGKRIGPGDILFIPDTTKGTSGKTAVGHFEEDGRYVLTTFHKDDGAIVGHHQVIITPRAVGVAPGAEFPTNAKLPPIPAKYGNPAQTPLLAEVQANNPKLDFDLIP